MGTSAEVPRPTPVDAAAQERLTVADVGFSGAKEFDAVVLKQLLLEAGLAQGQPFDKALAERAEQLIKRQYMDRGLYATEVETMLAPLGGNLVNVTFKVLEGDVARIAAIRIVGNQAFPEATLRELFSLDTAGWMNGYTQADRYSQAKLNADLKALRAHYMAQGYLDFRVDSAEVEVSPDKRRLAVTIKVFEGQRFVVSSVSLEGDYLGREAEFLPWVSVRLGEAYDPQAVSRTVTAFLRHFGASGYAFAQVEAQPVMDRANGRIALVLQARPAQRIHVRSVRVVGNERTQDEVVLREVRHLASTWYDVGQVRRARNRLVGLRLFSEAGIDIEPVPGAPDQVDLAVKVVERPTGSFSMGAGYSQAELASLYANVEQLNVLGSGSSLRLDLNASQFNQQIALSTTNPFIAKGGVSRTVDVYYRTTHPYHAQGGDYEIATPGMGIRFGIPLGDTDLVSLGLGVERVKITQGNRLPEAYVGQGATYLPATVRWTRDGRNSATAPTAGRLQRLNTEIGVGSDRRYAKLSYKVQQFIPLSPRYTLALNAELGVGKGLGGKAFPVLRNFYGGGLGSVRGFSQGTLGPTSKVVGSSELVHIGGARNVVLNAEFLAPFPGVGTDEPTLRWFAFVDVGNVFGESEKVDFDQMRASVGLGLSWISPIGPLRFAWASPLRKFAGDKTQRFQFQVGASF